MAYVFTRTGAVWSSQATIHPTSPSFISDFGYSVALTEEQFQAEMAKRRQSMKSRNDYDIGCPLCWAPPTQTATQPSTAERKQ